MSKPETDCFTSRERELHCYHFAFHSARWLFEGISHIILLDRLRKDMGVVHRVTASE